MPGHLLPFLLPECNVGNCSGRALATRGREFLMLFREAEQQEPGKGTLGWAVSPQRNLTDSWALLSGTSVRDAAARLPNGEGTRAEICELLKDSQFLAPDVTSTQVSWETALNCLPQSGFKKTHWEIHHFFLLG